MIWGDSTAGVHKQLGPQTMSAGSYSLKGMILTGIRASSCAVYWVRLVCSPVYTVPFLVFFVEWSAVNLGADSALSRWARCGLDGAIVEMYFNTL